MTLTDHAQLALLLEVAGTPKPGNVDRHRDYPDLRFEHFLAGAAGARAGLERAASGVPVGEAFETAVRGMSQQDGGNTQFGALLLVVPLVVAAADGDVVDPELATAVVEKTTVDDAAAFYRAFDHVDVAVPEPPPDATELDVRLGSQAIPAVRDRGLTLEDIMELSAPRDGIAREWIGGFERTFGAVDRLRAADGPVTDRAARVSLELLAAKPDPFVVTTHGPETAARVRERAVDHLDASREELEGFADDLVAEGINPGTTADLVAGALFVALHRGLVRV